MRIKVPSLLRALEGTTISLDQIMPTAHTSTTGAFSFLSQLLSSSTSSLLYTCSPTLENKTALWCWGTQGHLYPVYHPSASNPPFFALLFILVLDPVNTSPRPAGGMSHLVNRGHCKDFTRQEQQEAISIPGSGPPQSSVSATCQVSSSCVFRPCSPISSCF